MGLFTYGFLTILQTGFIEKSFRKNNEVSINFKWVYGYPCIIKQLDYPVRALIYILLITPIKPPRPNYRTCTI